MLSHRASYSVCSSLSPHPMARSVVKPTDIARFDERVSPHELKAFCEKLSDSGSDDFNFDDTMDTKEGRKRELNSQCPLCYFFLLSRF